MNDRMAIVEQILQVVWDSIQPDMRNVRQARYAHPFVRNNYQNAFVNRIIGFRAELQYAELVKHNPLIQTGGWFVPKAGQKDPLGGSRYFAVLEELNDTSKKIYGAMGRAARPSGMYAIVRKSNSDLQRLDRTSYNYYLFKEDTGDFLTVSDCDFFSFWLLKQSRIIPSAYHLGADENIQVRDFCRNYLNSIAVSTAALATLLLTRHLFDIEICRKHRKGRPTDIDFIKLQGSGSITLIDVKDKYPSKEGMLGVNADHLSFFVQIDELLKTCSQCVVLFRERRNSLATSWIFVPMKKFLEGTRKDGRSGMNSEEAKPTLLLPISEFALLTQQEPDSCYQKPRELNTGTAGIRSEGNAQT